MQVTYDYGWMTGQYMLDPSTNQVVHFKFLFPAGATRTVRAKTSWFTQGKPVADGHEVAHSKLGSSGNMKGVMPAIHWAGDDYVCYSGDFTNQYNEPYAESYRNYGTKAIRVQVFLSRSANRLDVLMQYAPIGHCTSHGTCVFPYFRNFFIRFQGSLSNYSWSTYTGDSASRDQFLRIAQIAARPFEDMFSHPYQTRWQTCSQIANAIIDMCLDWHLSLGYSSRSMANAYPGITMLMPKSGFVLDEPHTLLGGDPIMVPFGAYHLKALRQAAYLDALESVPKLNDNSISNVLEIVGTIKSLVLEHKIEVPDNLMEAWLSYRYQYTTTKLDVHEAMSYLRRAQHDLRKGFSCYGRASGKITSDVTAVVKCKMSMKSRELSYLDNLISGLFRYGLSPSSYVIWDMVPYSFIVDWFIPVGDILHGHDMDVMYNRIYDISDIWYSLSYDNVVDGNVMSQYTRWSEQSTPELSGFYTIETESYASKKVCGFRVLDSLSLIFSR